MAWPTIYPMVESAMELTFGEYSMQDILLQLMQGVMQLWVAVDENKDVCGLWLTEIHETPQRRICHCWLLVGRDLKHWQGGLERVEEWAASKGCSLLQGFCRPGLGKIAKSLGFRVRREVVYKPILANQQ